MKLLLILFLFAAAITLQAQVPSATIGKQVWMTENLNVDKFRNGEAIPEAKTDEEWKKAGDNQQPAWCYYDNRAIQNDPENGDKYGKLYNWYAVADARGLCPVGWHVPSDDEWTMLINALGGDKTAGDKIKSSSGWSENGNGSNSSRFGGLPSGFRGYYVTFGYIGFYGSMWSSSEYNTSAAWGRDLGYSNGNVNRGNYDKEGGLSVRCLKN